MGLRYFSVVALLVLGVALVSGCVQESDSDEMYKEREFFVSSFNYSMLGNNTVKLNLKIRPELDSTNVTVFFEEHENAKVISGDNKVRYESIDENENVVASFIVEINPHVLMVYFDVKGEIPEIEDRKIDERKGFGVKLRENEMCTGTAEECMRLSVVEVS